MADYRRKNREIRAVGTPGDHTEDVYESARLRAEEEKNRQRKRRFRLGILLLAVLLLAGFQLFHRFARYDTYAVMWQKDLGQGSLVGYQRFGPGVLKYSRDGVTFLTGRGQENWVDTYEMKAPMISVNGSYAVIADVLGNAVRIYNLEGKIGELTTVLPLTKADIAGNGVTAVIQEDASASYIVFFRKDGSPLDITVKSILAGDGYPTDLALSPDGKRLMVSYAYVSAGRMNGRVVFYDFSEIGKSIPNRLVGGFDEPFSDALVADVYYMSANDSVAASTAGLSFFSSRNLASPELVRQVKIEGEIQSVFYDESYVGVIVNDTSGKARYRLELYKRNGHKAMECFFDDPYRTVSIDGEMIFLLSPTVGTIFNTAGIQKFHGELDFPVVYMKKGASPGEFLMAGPSNLKGVRLR